ADHVLADDDNLDHEYLPILGLEGFRKASVKLILGADSKAIAEGRVGAAQCISGTGAVYTGASFLLKHYPFKNAACYISKPTWVLSHVETGIGTIIKTSDNMMHEGNILVGADGTYSAVRQCLYEQLEKNGKLPSSDKKPLGYSTVCLVGQARSSEPTTYEYSDEKSRTHESVVFNEKPLFFVAFTTAEETICWVVLGFMSQEKFEEKIGSNVVQIYAKLAMSSTDLILAVYQSSLEKIRPMNMGTSV
ncbi:Aspartate aminotransferase, cytoplasmic, partial [Mortierella sp. AM989]